MKDFLLFTASVLLLTQCLIAKPLSSDQDELEENFELGPHFQGDIVLTPEQEEVAFDNTDGGRSGRTGLKPTTYRWPKNAAGQVVVPYIISSPYSTSQKNLIRSAMDGIQAVTCVRFVQRTTQRDYVNIFSGTGCSSRLGRIGGRQDVSLRSNGCVQYGVIQHELIHALGYTHMQNHVNRDNFVTINFQNILQSAKHNFERVSPNLYDNFETNYDYGSVMHYGRNDFTSNGKPTIVPKNSNVQIGQRNGMSSGDIQRIKNMYKC